MAHWSSGYALCSEAGGLRFKPQTGQIDTVLPRARHSCDLSSREAMLLGRNDVEIGSSILFTLRCTVIQRVRYNKIFDLIFRFQPGLAPLGGILGPCPPKRLLVPPQTKLCPPSEDCAPKKLMGSGLPECKSRPETLKIVLIASEFVKNRTIFGTKTKFVKVFEQNTPFFLLHLRIRGQLNDFWGKNQNLWKLLN